MAKNLETTSQEVPAPAANSTQESIPVPSDVAQKVRDSLGAFGADLSHVRVFTDSSTASSVGAHAFTIGNDIHFAPGTDVRSEVGKELLRHEVTHVLQHRKDKGPANEGLGRATTVRAFSDSAQK